MEGEEVEKQWSNGARKKAVLAPAPEFKAQASSLTFEGCRREIEQDLCMNPLSLDAHKKIVKRCLEECLSGDGGEKAPELSGNSKSKSEKSTTEEPEETRNTSDIKNTGASNSDETQESGTEIINEGNGVSKDMIKEALKERASFFKQHQDTITFMKVRRLLEEDLNIPVKTLDVHKAFVNAELDKVLASLEEDKSENGVQKKPKKASKKVEKTQKHVSSKRTREKSDSSDNGSREEEHSEEVKPKRRKKAVSKVKATASTKNSANQKNLVENKYTVSKSKKVAKKEREDNSDEEKEGGNSSHKNESGSSDEEGAEKKREKLAQVYGKKVEHLKSIIKSCGLSIPPVVYRRAKQAPEDRRETFLIKELEEILEKEGLSANPSEKEIKEVKRKKERAKELEGIDMSNVITSSRRRSSAFSYIPPPKPPKIGSSSDDDDDEDDDSDDDNDDVDPEKGDLNGDDDDDDGDGDDGGDNGGDNGGDEGNDNDGHKGKESDQDGGDDND